MIFVQMLLQHILLQQHVQLIMEVIVQLQPAEQVVKLLIQLVKISVRPNAQQLQASLQLIHLEINVIMIQQIQNV